MKRDPALAWMGGAFCANSLVAAGVLGIAGAGKHGTILGLQATARVAFLLFWCAYAGGALAALTGHFAALRRHGRDIGLAFAVAQAVHFSLVLWLCWIGAAPATGVFVFFGIALFWVAALALFSIAPVRRAFGSIAWWIVRRIGMNYIALAFAVDFLNHPPQANLRYLVAYVPFGILSVIGPLLVLWAATMPLLARKPSPLTMQWR